jgi:dTDP-glucose 4,6-dehydratase
MGTLVTGGCGFIGHHFVRAWRAAHPGEALVVLDALTYAADPARVAGLATLIRGDICDPGAVRTAFETLGHVDRLVHFAAETHVDRSIVGPASFVRTNVLGTGVLLDVARERGVGRFLHVSTDEVYGSVPSGAPATPEEAPFAARSPYAASKVGAEALVSAAFHTWGVPTVIARPANTFGTGQYPEKLLPVLIGAALAGRPLPLYGDGLHERDWLAVDEHVEALGLLTNAAPGSVWNIPGTGPRTNRSVAEAVCAALRLPASRIVSVADRPGHDRRYHADGTRLAALGFRARQSIEEALPDLIAEARQRG